MKHKNKIIFGSVIIALLIITVILIKLPSKHGVYDSFATCLGNSGAKFYGAFWCPHCADQKALFGRSVKFLPYVECSSPSGSEQLPICTEKGIKGYPTWIFADGSEKTGLVSLEDLSKIANCPLPVQK